MSPSYFLCPQHDILAGASPQSHNIVRHTAASVFLPTWYQRYWYSHRHFLFPMLPVSWLWNWPLPPWSVIKGERFARLESTYKGSYWSLHGFSTLRDIDYLVPRKQITLPAEIFFPLFYQEFRTIISKLWHCSLWQDYGLGSFMSFYVALI